MDEQDEAQPDGLAAGMGDAPEGIRLYPPEAGGGDAERAAQVPEPEPPEGIGTPIADAGAGMDLSPEPPFTVETGREAEEQDGRFRPTASLRLNASLRTSGLLRALPAEDAKSLLFVLTYLSPNGHMQPSAYQLAGAMGLSVPAAEGRMRRLTRPAWQGRPLLVALARADGAEAYTPAPFLVAVTARDGLPGTGGGGQAFPPGYRPAGHDAIMARTREQYARPREEVEREIARRYGWDVPGEMATPGERERAELRNRLEACGIGRFEADGLLERFGRERVERQLEWLPYRNAQRPGRYLAAAIEGDYAPPLAARLRQAAGQDARTAEPDAAGDAAPHPPPTGGGRDG